uniref:MATE family efflux transporter n=1 Tax=Alloprevotella sp. TaxID=1872471 RepID=UPI003FEDD265
MNKQILHIALPSIISNITVPLLALVDTTIVGHLGSASYIAAIALGGMIFNMIYWLFNFLRMGTGGLTAQAYGANQHQATSYILLRSLTIAGGIALTLLLLQRPIFQVTFHFVTATAEVRSLASIYFNILIWGAPAMLALYSFTGWFLGMQNARIPMCIAITQNVVNIAVSTLLVFGCHLKIEGVALGTLISQYTALLLAVIFCLTKFDVKQHFELKAILDINTLKRFFQVNRDIFLRTLCLIAVTTYFTSAGSTQGELTLAANTLLMQFFIIFSYFMDGFAYAGEALGGRYFGAHDRLNFQRVTRCLFAWGGALSVLFFFIYFLSGTSLLHLLTNDSQVINRAQQYLPIIYFIPLISFAAFLFDGLYIGTTATRYMLISMFCASAAFFVLINVCTLSNTLLWLAFLVYLGGRGLMQAFLFKKAV